MTKPLNKRDPNAEHRAAAHDLMERLAAHVKATQTTVEGNLLRVGVVGLPGPRQRAVWYCRGSVGCRLQATMILTTHVHERLILARKISVD